MTKTKNKVKGLIEAMQDYEEAEPLGQSSYNFEDVQALITLYCFSKQGDQGCEFANTQLVIWFQEVFKDIIADAGAQTKRFQSLLPLFSKAVRLAWYIKNNSQDLELHKPARSHKYQKTVWTAEHISTEELHEAEDLLNELVNL